MPTRTCNVIAIVREGQKYVFLFDDDAASLTELHREFGRLAADPELNFQWSDALAAMRKARELARLAP